MVLKNYIVLFTEPKAEQLEASLFLKRSREIVKCDIIRMLVTLCFLVVGRATWSEFRRNQEQAHFWTPNELPRIIETMKGLKPVC